MIKLVSQKEIIKHLRVSSVTFRKMMRNNPDMPKIQVGEKYKFNIVAIDRWLSKKFIDESKNQ